MMQTIAVFNTRGGSGKSAVTVFLADFLATACDESLLEWARLHSPIFQDPSDEMDDTWQHGVLIGGMAGCDRPQVARAYKLAADELVTQALSKHEPHELAYPVLFL